MAPITERRTSVIFDFAKRVAETDMPTWPWTIGDDSDGEGEMRISSTKKRRVRRQAPAPVPPPPETGVPVEPVPDDAATDSLSSSESDGISSESSAEEDDAQPTQSTGESVEQVRNPMVPSAHAR